MKNGCFYPFIKFPNDNFHKFIKIFHYYLIQEVKLIFSSISKASSEELNFLEWVKISGKNVTLYGGYRKLYDNVILFYSIIV